MSALASRLYALTKFDSSNGTIRLQALLNYRLFRWSGPSGCPRRLLVRFQHDLLAEVWTRLRSFRTSDHKEIQRTHYV